MSIWKGVPDSPDSTAGNYNSVSFSQATILPQHKLSVGCMSVLLVFYTWLLVFINCKDVIPGSTWRKSPSSKTYKSMYADWLTQFSGLCLQHLRSKSVGISLQLVQVHHCGCPGAGVSGIGSGSRKSNASNISPGSLNITFSRSWSFWSEVIADNLACI